jgi:hypothetical protein
MLVPRGGELVHQILTELRGSQSGDFLAPQVCAGPARSEPASAAFAGIKTYAAVCLVEILRRTS